MSSLVLENLVYRYGEKAVIDELSLVVAQNEIVCLLGASGCGKTTTLKAIAGLLTLEQGQIKIGDQLVNDGGLFVRAEHRNIGMMFQDYALFPHLTVAQNIAFGLSAWPKQARQARVDEMLQLIKLPDIAARYPHQLSGGQQQRVAIARALAYKPKFLLLDEPFSNIDHQVRFQLMEEIRQIIKSQQVSAIFVTHSKEEAFAFADKLAVMDRGKIVQLGYAEDLFTAPNSKLVAEFLGPGIYLAATYNKNIGFTTELGLFKSDFSTDKASLVGELYLRPQHLELTADLNGVSSVLGRRFMGEKWVYRVEIASQLLELPASNGQILEVGECVSVSILTHQVNFFIQSNS